MVFFLDIGFHGIAQRCIACFVALHNFAGCFVHDNHMVIFVKYFHKERLKKEWFIFYFFIS